MTKPTETTDPLTSVALALIKARETIDSQLRALADIRPPVSYLSLIAARCNFEDRSFEREVEQWKEQHDSIDCSVLPDEDGDKWEIVHGSDRYEVRAVAEPMAEGGAIAWRVIDTVDRIAEPFDDEDEACSACERYNAEDYRENCAGFPFAQTYGFEIEEREVEWFASAGFVVVRYDGDKLIAGIDGGGYSLLGAHWAPAFWSYLTSGYPGLVETDSGPRRPELPKEVE